MQKIKNIIKFSLVLIIGIILIRHSYKGFDLKEIFKGVKEAKYSWLFLATIFNILSHVFRAARWRLLILPLKYSPSIFNCFIADLSGLFSNIFLPRLGEIFRCTALKRMNNIPVSSSITTVIVERSSDVIVFLIIVLLSFFIFNKHMSYILKEVSYDNFIPSYKMIYIISSILIFTFILALIFKKYLKKIYVKIIGAINSFRKNLVSILNNDKKTLIMIYTLFIWLFYFLSIYVVFFSIKSTSNLKISAGIIVLIASSLGLSAPVQGGGAGAMHILVVSALSIFSIAKKDSILSATLIHGVQFLSALIFGGLAMTTSFFLKYKK